MLKALLLVLGMFASTFAGNAAIQTHDPGKLFPIFQNGKVGYLDATGRIVIAPKFDLRTSPSMR